MTRTITHLYDRYDDATRAVSRLEAEGIPQSDISIVGHDGGAAATGYAQDVPGTASFADLPDDGRTVAGETGGAGTGAGAGASVGTVIGGGLGLLAGIGALAIPGVGPVVAAGWLIATVTGAGVGAGAGGLLGSLVGAGHPEEDAHVYAEGVRRGGTLVSVRVDDARAAEVDALLSATGRVDIAQRGEEYRSGGWSRFDQSGEAPLATPRPASAVVSEANPGAYTGREATPPLTTTEIAERQRIGAATHV